MKRPRSSSVARRTRVTLATFAITFIAIQLGFSLIVVPWRPQYRDPLFYDKFQRLQRRLNVATTDRPWTIIALGSSRVGCGFNAKRSEEQLSSQLGKPVVAANMAVPGGGVIAQRVYLQRILDAGHRPDVVMLEILPPLLSGDSPASHEQATFHGERLWYRELPIVERHGYPREDVRSRWRQSNLVPLYASRFPLLARVARNDVPPELRAEAGRMCDAHGWNELGYTVVTPELYAERIALARSQYHATVSQFRLSDGARAPVRECVELCREHGIRLILLLMPEGNEFAGWYSPGAREQIGVFVHSFGVPVIDARNWVPDCEFVDSHHLITAGALRFTELIATEIAAAR
jgi:hypothetical protein